MRRTLRILLFLVFALTSFRERALASSTATIAIGGAEQSGDTGQITVSFNNFVEAVQYGQFSTPSSIASAFAGMFSRDYIADGLCANASGATITFHLSGVQTFGPITVTGPTTSFSVYTSSWPNPPAATTPVFTPVTGTFAGPQRVSITDMTSGATIYYTTDGTTPSTASSVYSGQFTVSSSSTIKAFATAPGYSQSPIAAVRYMIANGPTITGISPVGGPIGTSVTISGGGFGTTGSVTFNGVPGFPTSWGIDTVTVPVPSGATSGPISITNSVGTSNGLIFTVGAVIGGIAPATGNVGTTVVINGSGFGTTQGSSQVMFNGVPASPSNWSNSSITVAVPAGATTGNVAVLINGMAATGPVFDLSPAIASLSPSSGPIGTVVTISGSNFGPIQGGSKVAFGQVTASPRLWSQNTIVVPVPAGAVGGPVVVTVGGSASNAVSFNLGSSVTTGSINGTVTQSDGVTPVVGTTLTVYEGTNAVATTVTGANGKYSVVNLAAATYSLQANAAGFGSAEQSSVIVSEGQATVVNLTLSSQRTISYIYDKNGRLTSVADSATGSATYTYDAVGNITRIARAGTAQVSILGFSPAAGPVGTQLTISGIGFAAIPTQNTVFVGGAAASVVSGTSTQLIVTVPAAATTGPIIVTNDNGLATSSTSFSVTPAGGINGPSITSFAPAVGNIGATVTISGTGFDSDPTQDFVQINGVAAAVTSAATTNLSIVIPENGTSGPISVQTPGGQAVSSLNFAVIPAAFSYQPSQVDFVDQLTIGQSYTGTINTAGHIGIVTFNAVAGQMINLAVTNPTIGSAMTYVSEPNGSFYPAAGGSIGAGGNSLILGDWCVNCIAAPLTGTYTVVIANTSSSGSLTFTMSANPAAVPISPGTSTNLSINTPGQNASVSFTGTAGQWASLQVTNLSFPCSSTYLYLVSPDGTNLASSGTPATTGTGCSPSIFLGPVTLPATGTYKVFLAPVDGSTGTATLTAFLFNEPPPVNVMPGTPTQFTINTPGQNAQFTFSGTAGQLATLQLQNAAVVDILSPDGTSLFSPALYSNNNNTYGPIVLPANGVYTVAVAPPTAATGSLNVTLSLNSQTGTTITPAIPTSATINTPGQSAQFIFNGVTGQYASVMLSQSTFSSQVSIVLYDSSGDKIASSSTGNILGPVLLGTNDTYTLSITPNGGGTGSVVIALSLSSLQSGGTISSGNLVPFSINTPGQSVAFSFSGTTGQLATVLIPNPPFPDGTQIAITNPDGTELLSSAGNNFAGPIALPVTGTYTLTVAPQNEDTGSAGVSLWLFNNQTGSISSEAPVRVNIDIPGQSTLLSFAGTAGQDASVTLSNITFTQPVYLAILNPDGTTLVDTTTNFTDYFRPTYGLAPTVLPTSGTYTLVITPENVSTGGAIATLSVQ